MRTFLQWLTGSILPPGDVEASVSLQGGLSPGWALLLLLIGAAVIVWSYQSGGAKISKTLRTVLTALRLGSFVVLMLLLLKPVLSLRIEEPTRSALLVLFDNSRSMQIVDDRTSETDRANARDLAGVDQPPRAALVRSLAENTSLDLFAKLAKVVDLKFESFGEQCRTLGDANEGSASKVAREAVASLKFDETATGLGDAISETLTNWRGTPISGILLVTDGATNNGIDPLVAARTAAADRVPIYIYGTGLPEAKDLRVISVTVPPVAFLGESTEARVSLRLQGYPPGTSVHVSLRQGDKVWGEQTGIPGTEITELTFPFVPDTAGLQDLSVIADPLPQEVRTENNTGSTSVRVVDQKVQLLYIVQRPHWDFRFITNTLKDDRRVGLKCHVIEGQRNIEGEDADIYIDTLPQAAELLRYQVVLLDDVDPAALGRERMETLASLVSDTGGGLIFLAGPRFNPAAYKGTPLETLLPVDLEPVTDQAAYEARPKELQKLRLTSAGEYSPLLKLADDTTENRTIWDSFTGVRWFAGATRSKPTAETLLTSARDIPVCAIQTFGRGQTLYFGTDETYRWRSKVGSKYFIRIWTQIIQSFALERLQGASDKIQLRPDRPVLFAGDTVQISGRVFDDNFKPLALPRLEGELVREGDESDAQALSLDLSPETRGLYTGKWTARQPGNYLFVPLRDRKAVTRFEVRSRDVELLNPRMEKQLLESIAKQTKGRFLAEPDLARLPELLQTVTITIPRRVTIDLFALWSLLALFAALLLSEWTVRRLSRLK